MVKPRGYFKRPPGPLAGMWSWRYLDKVKTFRMITTRRVRGFYEDFPNQVPVGTPFPEIQLLTTTGSTVNTADLKGRKHFVLFTGAIT